MKAPVTAPQVWASRIPPAKPEASLIPCSRGRPTAGPYVPTIACEHAATRQKQSTASSTLLMSDLPYQGPGQFRLRELFYAQTSCCVYWRMHERSRTESRDGRRAQVWVACAS